MDIFRFIRNGILRAKGFFNQEGLIFYVLPGSSEDLYRALAGTPAQLNEVSSLPGEDGAQLPEFPCGHPRNPGDDICSGLDCNPDLLF